MTAAAPAVGQAAEGVSAAGRKAQRAARIRGVILAALGVVALQLAVSSLDTPAVFSFWVDRQGGSSISITTTVGLLGITGERRGKSAGLMILDYLKG